MKALLLLLCLSIVTPMFGGINSKSALNRILKNTPEAQVVLDGKQFSEAEKISAQYKNSQVFMGTGESMLPLYPPKTAIVVAPIDYNNIKKGMTVVYVKKNGHVVAHSVVGEDAKGYIVQGVNNDVEDRESVNEKNIVGVIVSAVSSEKSNFKEYVASI